MQADTGPIGGNLSHEFIILAETGESEVFCHRDYLDFPVPGVATDYDDVAGLQQTVDTWTSLYAATSEKHDSAAYDALPADKRVSARGIEVGHIFYFGTKYSEPMKATVQGADGKPVTVHMGSYGIGPSRVVAAVIEACHDKDGIVWPVPLAPFEVGVVNLKAGDAQTDAACGKLYEAFANAGIDVLYDDTDERAGAKFATMDLVGIPYQVIVGPKGLKTNEVEIKHRKGGQREMLSPEAAIEMLVGRVRAERLLA
jgi:prolyl-tRNA synthetase